MTYEEIFTTLNEILNLEGYPVGISVLGREPRQMAKIEHRMYFCQMWRRARFGETFYLTEKELTCPGGRENLGLVEQTAIYNGLRAADYSNNSWVGTGREVVPEDKSRVYPLPVWKNPKVAVRTYFMEKRIQAGSVKALILAPLPKYDQIGISPDVVLLACTPEQGMRLVKAILWHTGGHICGHTGGASCSECVAKPYLTGEVTFCLSDGGFRTFAKLEFDKLLMGIPVEKLDEYTLENIRELAEISRKYGMWP